MTKYLAHCWLEEPWNWPNITWWPLIEYWIWLMFAASDLMESTPLPILTISYSIDHGDQILSLTGRNTEFSSCGWGHLIIINCDVDGELPSNQNKTIDFAPWCTVEGSCLGRSLVCLSIGLSFTIKILLIIVRTPQLYWFWLGNE